MNDDDLEVEWPDHLPKPLGAATNGQLDFEDGSWINLSNHSEHWVTPGLRIEVRRRLLAEWAYPADLNRSAE